jgi:hypothetical protein
MRSNLETTSHPLLKILAPAIFVLERKLVHVVLRGAVSMKPELTNATAGTPAAFEMAAAFVETSRKASSK